MAKELKYLKQQQKSNSNELVVASKEENYPLKIKQLIEEVRVSREQQL